MKHLVLATLFGLSFTAAACAPPPYFNTLTVRLIDASSGKLIPNRAVKIKRYLNRRCVKAPCPQYRTAWQGDSDPTGRIMIPRRAFRLNHQVQVDGYQTLIIRTMTRRSRVNIKLAPENNARQSGI